MIKMMDALIHNNRAKKTISKFNQDFFTLIKSKSKIMKFLSFLVYTKLQDGFID